MSDTLDFTKTDAAARPHRIDATRARETLSSHAIFGALHPPDIERLAAAARYARYERGERIFSRDDPGGSLVSILSGAVRISAAARSGAEIAYNVIQAGEHLGEISLLDGRPRTADAIALSPCEVMILERRDVLPLLLERPDFALRLLDTLCERMRRLCPQVEDALFLDTPARLANTILRHAQPNGGLELRLRATQKQLGEMIGLSRESTNKQLQVWVRKNWIEIEKGGIVVRDPSSLSAAAAPR